jgi:hypothetical protein
MVDCLSRKYVMIQGYLYFISKLEIIDFIESMDVGSMYFPGVLECECNGCVKNRKFRLGAP